jgi:large subunit ribosomal protein L19
MNYVAAYEEKQLAKLAEGKNIPSFCAGDSVRVLVKIAVEGSTERSQAFEGLCIGRKNKGIRSSFTVRRMSEGHGVERTFPLYSPKIESITVVRRGRVRRAKLYYIRNLKGKAARIRERLYTGPNSKKVAAAAAAAAAKAQNA